MLINDNMDTHSIIELPAYAATADTATAPQPVQTNVQSKIESIYHDFRQSYLNQVGADQENITLRGYVQVEEFEELQAIPTDQLLDNLNLLAIKDHWQIDTLKLRKQETLHAWKLLVILIMVAATGGSTYLLFAGPTEEWSFGGFILCYFCYLYFVGLYGRYHTDYKGGTWPWSVRYCLDMDVVRLREPPAYKP